MIASFSRFGRRVAWTAGQLRQEWRTRKAPAPQQTFHSTPPRAEKVTLMSSPTPVFTVTGLVKLGIDFAVAAIVRSSDPTVRATKASAVITVCQDILGAWNSADPTSSIGGLIQVIFGTSASQDPATADAVKTLVLGAAQKILSLHNALAGTLTDTAITNMLNEVLGQVIATAHLYVPAAPAKAPAASPTVAPMTAGEAVKMFEPGAMHPARFAGQSALAGAS